MTVTVVVRDPVGREVRREKLQVAPQTTAAQLLARIGVPGTVCVGGKGLEPEDPVLPELEGDREVEVRDP